MMLKYIKSLLPTPNNLSTVRLEEEIRPNISISHPIDNGDETTITIQPMFENILTLVIIDKKPIWLD